VNDGNDKTYNEATAITLGRTFAGIMQGMIDGGMTREEAIVILLACAAALAGSAAASQVQPPQPKSDES
jgi:hypothetical protein